MEVVSFLGDGFGQLSRRQWGQRTGDVKRSAARRAGHGGRARAALPEAVTAQGRAEWLRPRTPRRQASPSHRQYGTQSARPSSVSSVHATAKRCACACENSRFSDAAWASR